MRIVLREDIDKLGRLGDQVDVKPGYGRNYLLPQGKALLATPGNLRAFEVERGKLQKKMDALRFASQDIAEQIKEVELVIRVRVGENEKLYGSVTSKHLAEALADRGIDISPRKIILDNPIKSLGEYKLEVKVHPEVMATLLVKVVRYDSEEQLANA